MRAVPLRWLPPGAIAITLAIVLPAAAEVQVQTSQNVTATVAGQTASANVEVSLWVDPSQVPPPFAFRLAMGVYTPPAPSTPYEHALETWMADDGRLLHGADSSVQAAIDAMKSLGVTRVRMTADWMAIAPDAGAKHRPAFDASDPYAYPDGAWSALDRAVALATLAGLKVDLDVGAGAPLWATTDPAGTARGVTSVDAAEYGPFAEAVARRYNGTAPYPTFPFLVPRVETFTLWNEPNDPAFLSPQGDGENPASPDAYRELVYAGYDAIKRARPDPTMVLVGATASRGGDAPGSGAVAPLRFLRALACVDDELAPVNTGSCAKFRKIPGNGWAHHAHSHAAAPWEASPSGRADDATLGDLPALVDLLRRLYDGGRVAAGLKDVWLTEFGYETDDPVWTKPWTTAEQARLLSHAEHLAWTLPAVRSFPQFLLSDANTQAALDWLAEGRDGRAPGSWQSGLYFEPGFHAGAAKPAAAGFRLTLLPTHDPAAPGSPVKLWGHVRPASGTGAAVAVERSVGAGPWQIVPTYAEAPLDAAGVPAFATDASAYFVRYAQPVADAQYRLVWASAAGLVYGPAESVGAPRGFTP